MARLPERPVWVISGRKQVSQFTAVFRVRADVIGPHEACFSDKIKRRLKPFEPKHLNTDFLLAGEPIYGEEGKRIRFNFRE